MNILKTISAVVRDPVRAISYALPYVNAALEPAARGVDGLSNAASNLNHRILNSPLVIDPAGVAKRNPGKTGVAGIVAATVFGFAGVGIHNDSVELGNRTRHEITQGDGEVSHKNIMAFIEQADRDGNLPKLESLPSELRCGFGDLELASMLKAGLDKYNAQKAAGVVTSMDGNKDGSISFPEAVNYASSNPSERLALSEALRAANPGAHKMLLQARSALSSNPPVNVSSN